MIPLAFLTNAAMALNIALPERQVVTESPTLAQVKAAAMSVSLHSYAIMGSPLGRSSLLERHTWKSDSKLKDLDLPPFIVLKYRIGANGVVSLIECARSSHEDQDGILGGILSSRVSQSLKLMIGRSRIFTLNKGDLYLGLFSNDMSRAELKVLSEHLNFKS